MRRSKGASPQHSGALPWVQRNSKYALVVLWTALSSALETTCPFLSSQNKTRTGSSVSTVFLRFLTSDQGPLFQYGMDSNSVWSRQGSSFECVKIEPVPELWDWISARAEDTLFENSAKLEVKVTTCSLSWSSFLLLQSLYAPRRVYCEYPQ